jgi:hypothetical protein
MPNARRSWQRWRRRRPRRLLPRRPQMRLLPDAVDEEAGQVGVAVAAVVAGAARPRPIRSPG